MKKDKKPFTKYWLKAKKLAEDKNVELAVPMLETMICNLAELSMKDEKEIEGVNIDLFKDRAWIMIEKTVGLPEYKPLYEK